MNWSNDEVCRSYPDVVPVSVISGNISFSNSGVVKSFTAGVVNSVEDCEVGAVDVNVVVVVDKAGVVSSPSTKTVVAIAVVATTASVIVVVATAASVIAAGVVDSIKVGVEDCEVGAIDVKMAVVVVAKTGVVSSSTVEV